MVPFICLQCGYREERAYTIGRICPECGRARLVAYTDTTPAAAIREERKLYGLSPKRVKPQVLKYYLDI